MLPYVSKDKWILLAGGGSGGHLYPGIAVAQALQQLTTEVQPVFFCSQRDIDRRILENTSFPFHPQPVTPFPGLGPGKFWPFYKNWQSSLTQCRQSFKAVPPLAALGLGGFASAPAMKTAYQMNIPTAMLNPDASPGKANRYSARYAQKIFIQWQPTIQNFPKSIQKKCLCTGCPIRNEFLDPLTHAQARLKFNLDPAKPTLAVMGGSQGGRSVNEGFLQCYLQSPKLFSGWQIVHLTGKVDYARIHQSYKDQSAEVIVCEYIDEMPALLKAADLVISRSGASTLAELTVAGVASILIPYPHHRDQHQWHNARILASVHAAKIVLDNHNMAKELASSMEICMHEKTRLQMAKNAWTIAKKDAAQTIAKELLQLANQS